MDPYSEVSSEHVSICFGPVHLQTTERNCGLSVLGGTKKASKTLTQPGIKSFKANLRLLVCPCCRAEVRGEESYLAKEILRRSLSKIQKLLHKFKQLEELSETMNPSPPSFPFAINNNKKFQMNFQWLQILPSATRPACGFN